jgi:hypothetical protein
MQGRPSPVDHRRHAAVGWIAISDGADETRTFARAALIVGRIEWRALVAHVSDNDLAPYSRHGASANAAARLGPERAADAREGETEFVYLPYSEAAGERIRPWTVGSDMGERAIDPAYLFERYGTEQRLRIRIEAHQRCSDRPDDYLDWILDHLQPHPSDLVVDVAVVWAAARVATEPSRRMLRRCH